MNIKTDWDKMFEDALAGAKAAGKKILLHCCCAPCAAPCLTRLEGASVAAYFFNPNIMPFDEYRLRDEHMRRLCGILGVNYLEDGYADGYVNGYTDLPEDGTADRYVKKNADRSADGYADGYVNDYTDRCADRHTGENADRRADMPAGENAGGYVHRYAEGHGDGYENAYKSAHMRFLQAAQGLENLPEGGARCEKCFYLRLFAAAEKAKKGGFDYFCTTLTLSPHKNADLINKIGFEIEKETGVLYLPSDFKKKNGMAQSIELCKKYGIYRQNYCGCKF